MNGPPDDLTRILAEAGQGDSGAVERLFPLVYEELRAIASRCLGGERPDHTLQPTALVNEAYLKLVDQRRASWADRGHFFAIAAMAMRRILVNHAKARGRVKRGGGRRPVGLDAGEAILPERSVDLVALDEALTRLAEIDADQAKIVELRFFAGLTVEEVAAVRGVSVRTVHYDWAMARAWLRGEIGAEDDGHDA